MVSRRARILIAAAAIVVIGIVVAVLVARDRRSKVPVQMEKVEATDLVSIVTASGEVRPKRFVDLSANVSGRIEELHVKEGDTVRKGQVLARIDAARFAAEARQSEAGVLAQRADLDRAQADLEVSRLNFERMQRMREENLVSEQTFQQAEAELKMKQAAVQLLRRRIAQQQAVLESSQDTLQKTVIVSPMDGAVTNLRKEQGEMVIGAQSFSPTVIMTVADLSVMEVEVLVDETDIRNVRLGQKAEVRVDALEGVKLQGDVTEIGASALPRGGTTTTTGTTATTANQAKDFKVTVTLEGPPSALRPGLNATADIMVARKEKVLAVPIQAVVVREVGKDGKVVDPNAVQAAENEPVLIRRRGEEKEGVFVVSGGKAVFKPVKTGIVGEADIEIVEGLAPGEQIVSGSYKTLRTLKDQAKVRLEKKES